MSKLRDAPELPAAIFGHIHTSIQGGGGSRKTAEEGIKIKKKNEKKKTYIRVQESFHNFQLQWKEPSRGAELHHESEKAAYLC